MALAGRNPIFMLQILILCFWKSVSASASCAPTLCKLRFELAKEVHSLRSYKNCDDVYAFDCICNRTIDVQFIEHPPYIYNDPATKSVVGLLPGYWVENSLMNKIARPIYSLELSSIRKRLPQRITLTPESNEVSYSRKFVEFLLSLMKGSSFFAYGILHEALSVCCNGCTKLRYLPPYKTTKEAIIMFSSSTVLLPFVTYSNAKLAVGDIFIATIPTKGVVYITSEDISMIHFSKFASSISSNWPLFCISLLLAVDAGIIVWLLDCARNGDEFPNDFLKGMLEGLWWAYVSMTTVGYGDKTPKSLAARAFGIFWITVGISLSGIFTASLITGMTQSLDDGPLNIEGKTVGILNATRYELTIGMREGAEIKGFATYEELMSEMTAGKLDGILLDVLVMKHYWKDLKSQIANLYYRSNAIKNSETSFGVLFSSSEDNTTNWELGKFLENFFLENRDNIDVIVKRAEKNLTTKLAEGIDTQNYSHSKSIFNSPEIYKLLFKYIGISTVVLVVLGFSFEKGRDWIALQVVRRKERKHIGIGSPEPSYPNEETTTAVESTTRILRARFLNVVKEMEISGNSDIKQLKERILIRVFDKQDSKKSFDNEIQLDEMQTNSEI